MKLLLFLALASTAFSAPSEKFFWALHQIESSGRTGAILGDYVNGKPRALGPLQIHRAAFIDSKIVGRYEQCADLAFSKRVASSYLRRYAPSAWKNNDVATLAAVWNGGPKGPSKKAAQAYAKKVANLAK
jgi:hypothetical protein